MTLKIRPLSYALGAEIGGVDPREPLSLSTLADVRAAFLQHGVLLFRDTPLTSEQHVAFSRQFGESFLNEDNAGSRHPDHPEILIVRAEPTVKRASYVGEYWHTDRSHECTPPMASLLRAVEVPDVGGDTMFANAYAAYETLSSGMKQMLDGLHAVHVGGGKRNRLAGTEIVQQTAQPVVRTHPETGRKALFITEILEQIVGMTPEESTPLLRFLCSHATRPQRVYRHQWRKHDLMMWDNRCMMHNALGDYDRSQLRHMERTTVLDSAPPSGYAYS